MPTAAPTIDQPAVRWQGLVADIGGTHARFGLLAQQGGAVEHVRQLQVAAHAGLAEAIQSYFDEIRTLQGSGFMPPRHAALAVATAIVGDIVDATNSHWRFSQRELAAQLGFGTLLALNDFEALALALPRLAPHQMRAHGAAPSGQGALAVIGPGTGLGVGGVVPSPRGWIAVPGEGGHATLAAGDDFEAALLAHVRREYEHVSAERLLSGIGMPVLHGAVRAVLGQAPEPLATKEIVERGLAGDLACDRTLDAFCALLGGFAGNVALTLGARGGVYIGGGIVPRLGERFFQSRFRDRFEAKGRFRTYLQGVPTALITDTLAALGGAALAIEQRLADPGAPAAP